MSAPLTPAEGYMNAGSGTIVLEPDSGDSVAPPPRIIYHVRIYRRGELVIDTPVRGYKPTAIDAAHALKEWEAGDRAEIVHVSTGKVVA